MILALIRLNNTQISYVAYKRTNIKMSKQSFNNKDYIERLKPFLVVVLVLAIIILNYYIFLNSNVIYGNSLLSLILFTFLITIPSILISIITVRSFLRSGSWSVLWLGIGTIIFGLSTFFRALFLNISTDNICSNYRYLGKFHCCNSFSNWWVFYL